MVSLALFILSCASLNNSKYISREVSVVGGKSYEILFSTLEPEIQEILNNEDNSCKA